MPRGNCPLCGSLVRAKGAKAFSRVTCEKCHAELHLGKEGRFHLGDPPDVEKEYQKLRREVRHLTEHFPARKVVIGLGVLVVLWLGVKALFGPAERLDSVANVAARAIADKDPDALTSLAAPGTAAEVQRWYDFVQIELARDRGKWGGRKEIVEARVSQEDRKQSKGAVLVSIRPAISGARDVSLADPAQATAAAVTPFEEATDWALCAPWGHWMLDGRATYARTLRTAGPP